METSALERKSRLAAIVQNQRAAQARRRALAAEFRARLQTEAAGGGIGRDTLIESAVSAYVEQSELSAGFLRGNASTTAIARLHLVRGQLARFLRLLGLISTVEDDDPRDSLEPRSESLAKWVGTLGTAANAGADTSGAKNGGSE